MSIVLRGTAASPGLALGQAVVWDSTSPRKSGDSALSNDAVTTTGSPEAHSLDEAMALYHAAAGRVGAELAALEQALAERAGAETAAIFGAQALLAQDPELAAGVDSLVRTGLPVADAVVQAAEEIAAELAALDDEYLRQRASDVRDVAGRIAALCSSGGDEQLPTLPYPSTILVAPDLAPAVLARLDPTRLKAIVTSGGSATSHLALLAKGLAIPAVVGCANVVQTVHAGDRLAVDGATGEVIVRPGPAEERSIQESVSRRVADVSVTRNASPAPTLTADGRRVILAANVGSVREVLAALAVGAAGIGLFRTEFLFLGRSTLPSESEQLAEYRAAAELMAPRRVVIRALDVGGDKHLPALPLPAESNPFLGRRGVRLWLERPDLALPQLRAILRAARYGAVDLLLPMVVNPSEVRRARELVEAARAALGDAAGACRVGIMVEVPAAALTIDHLAPDVDFFSIGTNDLTQYTLAAERGNAHVAELYDASHPAVLRLVQLTVNAAHAQGKKVSVCGDAAGDPRIIPSLIAIGVDELSMPPAAIPAARRQIRTLRITGGGLEHMSSADEVNG